MSWCALRRSIRPPSHLSRLERRPDACRTNVSPTGKHMVMFLRCPFASSLPAVWAFKLLPSKTSSGVSFQGLASSFLNPLKASGIPCAARWWVKLLGVVLPETGLPSDCFQAIIWALYSTPPISSAIKTHQSSLPSICSQPSHDIIGTDLSY